MAEITIDNEALKPYLEELLYAEHMGDVARTLGRLAPELGLPAPIWNEHTDYAEHPEIWPWNEEDYLD